MSWRLKKDCNSSGHSSISFPFSWAAQPGVWVPSLCWVLFSLFELEHSLQTLISNWSDFLSPPGYIIIWHQPASCGVTIRTQFNLSTVKVIPRYLRPDAPVIYTGVFLIWQLARVGGQYVTYVGIFHRKTRVTKFSFPFIVYYITNNSTLCNFWLVEILSPQAKKNFNMRRRKRKKDMHK